MFVFNAMPTVKVVPSNCRCHGRGCNRCKVEELLKLGLEQKRASERKGAKEEEKGSGSSSRNRRKKKYEVDEEANSATALELSKKSGSQKLSTPSRNGGSSSRSHQRVSGGTTSSGRTPSEGWIGSWYDPSHFDCEPWVRYGANPPRLDPNAVWIYMSPPEKTNTSSSPSSYYVLNVSYLPPEFATVAGLIPETIICFSKLMFPYDRKNVAFNVSQDITSENYTGNLCFKEVLSETVQEFGGSDPALADLVFEVSRSSLKSGSLSSSPTLSSKKSELVNISTRSKKGGQQLNGYRDGRCGFGCRFKPISSGSDNYAVAVKTSDVISFFLLDQDNCVTKTYGCEGYRVVTSTGPPRLSSHIHEKLMRKLYSMTIEKAQQRGGNEPVKLVSAFKL